MTKNNVRYSRISISDSIGKYWFTGALIIVISMYFVNFMYRPPYTMKMTVSMFMAAIRRMKKA